MTSNDRAPACDATVNEKVAAAAVAEGRGVRGMMATHTYMYTETYTHTHTHIHTNTHTHTNTQTHTHNSPSLIRAQEHNDIGHFTRGSSTPPWKALQEALAEVVQGARANRDETCASRVTRHTSHTPRAHPPSPPPLLTCHLSSCPPHSANPALFFSIVSSRPVSTGPGLTASILTP